MFAHANTWAHITAHMCVTLTGCARMTQSGGWWRVDTLCSIRFGNGKGEGGGGGSKRKYSIFGLLFLTIIIL